MRLPNVQRIAAQARNDKTVDILFVLIPLSVVLGLAILGALAWAVWRGQFEGVDAEGERILRDE